MKAFKIEKQKRRKDPLKRGVMYRFDDPKMLAAFDQAVDEFNGPAQQLLGKMIEHCLVETGHYKQAGQKK